MHSAVTFGSQWPHTHSGHLWFIKRHLEHGFKLEAWFEVGVFEIASQSEECVVFRIICCLNCKRDSISV